ncbi:serine/threonine-protein kinase [Lignipirellula cremea]|uniref:Serine/threonine-protein kinase StkP n=1 Tax=Lignipirellula cremea TaxID=2528010 RepID=A0A518DR74_9BACT|nr:serine/threonine-protein kinase [Lignipirellula cremea]QDU94337.1 Serine/threonine-protein kinase StkP [Lignipirellula cremea]
MCENASTAGFGACPSEQELLDFHSGVISESALEDIEAHLHLCGLCLERLEELPERPEMQALRHGWSTLEQLKPLGLAAFSRQLSRKLAVIRPTAEMASPPRRIGAWLLQEQIGSGGMGRVYRALHEILETTVALKILEAQPHDDLARMRFLMEMTAIGQVNSPHVVRAVDAGAEAQGYYLAMELVDGCDLGKLIFSEKRLPFADACGIIRQTALGLQAIHESGLIHRDLKPANLMLSAAGQVKILDLGLASWQVSADYAPQQNASRTMLGTLDYMSPEQSEARPIDARCDLYSLGCTFYHLLTGRAPFATPAYASAIRKIQAHCFEQPIAVRHFCPDIPDEAADLVAQLMAKSPAARPASAAEVADRLAPLASPRNLSLLVERAQQKWLEPVADDTPLSISLDPTQILERPADLTTEQIAPDRRLHAGWLLATGLLLLLGLFATALAAIYWQAAAPHSPAARSPVQPSGVAASTLPADASQTAVVHPTIQDFFEDLAPDALVPSRRYPLLNRKPHKLFWPGDELSSYTFDPVRKSLAVQSSAVSLFSLGQVTQPNFSLRFDLYQSSGSGGIGVFWGFQPDVLNGQPCHRFQLLELQVASTDAIGRHQYRFRRSQVYACSKQPAGDQPGGSDPFWARSGDTQFHSISLASQAMELHWRANQLELTCGPDGRESVHWRGIELTELRPSREPPADVAIPHAAADSQASQGHFGLYLSRASGQLPQASITLGPQVAP